MSKKIDVGALAPVIGTMYPPPYDEPCLARSKLSAHGEMVPRPDVTGPVKSLTTQSPTRPSFCSGRWPALIQASPVRGDACAVVSETSS
jgi:hypothetical protein